MAKNKIQFQKGISIHRFITQYGTDEQCRKRLFDMRWPTGYRCPNCGESRYCELKSRQLYQCNQCHHQASLTSGTLFSASKLPLNIWFLAIYLITQEKNGISALELSRQLGISYNAAWRMKHKLMQAMKERDDETPLSARRAWCGEPFIKDHLAVNSFTYPEYVNSFDQGICRFARF